MPSLYDQDKDQPILPPPPPEAPPLGVPTSYRVNLIQDPPAKPRKGCLGRLLTLGLVALVLLLTMAVIGASLEDDDEQSTPAEQSTPGPTTAPTGVEAGPMTPEELRARSLLTRMDLAVGMVAVATGPGGADQKGQADLAMTKVLEWAEEYRPVPDLYREDFFALGDFIASLTDGDWTEAQEATIKEWRTWVDAEQAYWAGRE